MGMHDRNYDRPPSGGRPPLPVVTKRLLIANVVVFLIDILGNGWLKGIGSFSIQSGVYEFKIYQLLTFQFLHATGGHILFNSIGLYVFGPFVERWWGSRKFLAYYLICGVSGGLFYALLYFTGILRNASEVTQLVGASAGIFGLIFAVYRLAPAVQVQLLFPPITLTMRQLALALGGWAVFMILGGYVAPHNGFFWNSGGEAGHLGGALMGLLLMSYPQLLSWAGEREVSVIRPKQFKHRGKAKIRPRTEVDLSAEDEVDRILEKISREGIGSLTAEERKTLEQATNNQ